MTKETTADIVALADAQAKAQEKRKRRRKGAGAGAPPGPPSPDAAPDGGEPAMPVKPLGHAGGRFWFVTRAGEVRDFGAVELHRRSGLADLFGGETEWLRALHPQRDRKGEVVGFDAESAGPALVKLCHAEGLYDATILVRGIGTWRLVATPDRPAGLLVHCGDVLLGYRPGFAAATSPAGKRWDGALYAAAPPVERPAPAAAPIAEADELLLALDRWNWAHHAAPHALLGWLAQAQLGAGPGWHPNALITAASGSGKTWLLEHVLVPVMGPAARFSNRYTVAGVRQRMMGEARAFILDESEDKTKADADVVAGIIELFRRMASGKGVASLQGSQDGRGESGEIVGCALLAAISPPTLLPQDASRFLVLELRPATPGAMSEADAQALAQRLALLSPRLRARMLAGWGRFERAVEAFAGALARPVAAGGAGLSGRGATHWSTLMAGYWTMTADAPPDEGAVAQLLRHWAGLLREDHAGAPADEGVQCLSHLLSTAVDHWRGGNKDTLGQMLLDACDRAEGDSKRKALGVYGLRLWVRPPLAPDIEYPEGLAAALCLLVANGHANLQRQFAGTRWDGGKHAGVLRRIGFGGPWAATAGPPMQFAGVKARCTAVPLQALGHEPLASWDVFDGWAAAGQPQPPPAGNTPGPSAGESAGPPRAPPDG